MRAADAESWMRDSLEPRHILTGDQLWLCLSCGAVVGAQYTHAEWHLENDGRPDA